LLGRNNITTGPFPDTARHSTSTSKKRFRLQMGPSIRTSSVFFTHESCAPLWVKRANNLNLK
jgi:hypothetical protein